MALPVDQSEMNHAGLYLHPNILEQSVITSSVPVVDSYQQPPQMRCSNVCKQILIFALYGLPPGD